MDFWKIAQEGIDLILIGWHSEPLSGLTEMSRAIKAYLTYQNPSGKDFMSDLGLSDADIGDIARETMLTLENELPNDYLNPLLTFNAFTSPFVEVSRMYHEVIVMGDGIINYFLSLGLGKVNSDFVHAHEFGHILQFVDALEEAESDIDIFIDIMFNTMPEESQRIELKANAYAAYFLACEQGQNFEIPLLLQAAHISFSIGDCNVLDPGHHSTPAQQECAML
jgi:predicted RNase H-like HicB family nuclease